MGETLNQEASTLARSGITHPALLSLCLTIRKQIIYDIEKSKETVLPHSFCLNGRSMKIIAYFEGLLGSR
ncbi:hypothetical protein EEL32_15545 [Brevibacillus laterosporus]|nr:hypothetical protein EEL31_20615 [Brevibacillus laterosporus]TPG84869.1 hypothetical protein EEL32_15545 [Brevibacillus laterosporus]